MKRLHLHFAKIFAFALILASCSKTIKQKEETNLDLTTSAGKTTIKLNSPLSNGTTEIEVNTADLNKKKNKSARTTSATGSINMIQFPDSSYTRATKKIDITGLTEFQSYKSVTDGNQTFSFSYDLLKETAFSSWNTWSSPPYSESIQAAILFTGFMDVPLTINLTKPSTTVGFELEPNAYVISTFSVEFYSGSTLVGTIIQDVDGYYGARLFAATSKSKAFDRIQIKVIDGIYPSGFAIANLRYSPTKNVDLDIKPGSCPNVLNVNSNGVIPVAILGKSDFDVNSIDLSSIKLQGVSALRSSLEDVGSPVVNRKTTCDCSIAGADGFKDLSLKFDTKDIVEKLGTIKDGDNITLTITGKLKDGTPIEGKDCISVIKNK
ncbi:MAG TPA: hypothetical protein VNS32_29285 [Flavisolibacter sp.]|nr:hypothetical protein [Flavisolibacter sp.]